MSVKLMLRQLIFPRPNAVTFVVLMSTLEKLLLKLHVIQHAYISKLQCKYNC